MRRCDGRSAPGELRGADKQAESVAGNVGEESDGKHELLDLDGVIVGGQDLEGGGAVEDQLGGDGEVDHDGDRLVVPAEEALHVVEHGAILVSRIGLRASLLVLLSGLLFLFALVFLFKVGIRNYVGLSPAQSNGTAQEQSQSPAADNDDGRHDGPVDQVHVRLVAQEERLVVLHLEQQPGRRLALQPEVGVEVGLAVLLQHVVDAHDQARVEEVQVGVGLRVGEESEQPHKVGAHDGGQRRQVGRRGRVGDQRVGDLQQLGELLEVADAVAHVDAARVALAVPRHGQLARVAPVGTTYQARGEGGVRAGHAVGVALLGPVVDRVEEVPARNAPPI